MRRAYRTRSQAVIVGLTGLFSAVVIPWQALTEDELGRRISFPLNVAFAAIAISFGAFCLLRVTRCGVYPKDGGLRVMNPFSSEWVSWTDVVGFSLRPWGPYPAIGHVDLRDGRSIHIWGIEAPNPLFRPKNRSAQLLLQELEQLRPTEPDR